MWELVGLSIKQIATVSISVVSLAVISVLLYMYIGDIKLTEFISIFKSISPFIKITAVIVFIIIIVKNIHGANK